jgi:integrase
MMGLAELLADRVSQRAPGRPFSINLRGAKWGNLGVLTVRRPGSDGWPHRGLGTDDLDEARLWARSYESLVRAEITLSRYGAGSITIEDMLIRYQSALESSDRPRSTIINRRSQTKRLSAASIGSLPAATVTAELVEACVHTAKRQDGRLLEAASQRALIDALGAAWASLGTRTPAPWKGATPLREDASAARRKAAEEGEILATSNSAALLPEEFLDALAWAHLYDQDRLMRPNVQASTIPGTTPVIMALQASTLTRINELLWLRWKHIEGHRRAVNIPGTKNKNAVRSVVLSRAAMPWLEEARRLWASGRGPNMPAPIDFIIRTRTSSKRSKASSSTVSRRVLDVLVAAGLKRTRASTHVLRKTGSTMMGQSALLQDRHLQAMLGHAGASETTDLYLSRAWSFPEEWTEILTIPTPEEVRRRAAEVAASPGFSFPTPEEIIAMKADLEIA